MKITKITIELEFDDNAKPLPGARAMLYKLLGLKPSLSAPASPDPDPKKNQSFLDVPPRLQAQDKRKTPHIFKESIIPCPGGCGRMVKYRGAGIKPKCPACGGTGKVVEEEKIIEKPPANLPLQTNLELPGMYIPGVRSPPPPPITESVSKSPLEATLVKKVCPDCKTLLIVKYGQFYCPKCGQKKDPEIML